MNVYPPINGIGHHGPAGEDLDELLGRYFRREMPDPWPAPPAVHHASPRRRGMLAWLKGRSRLALAASVALFVLGYLAVTAAFPTREAPGLNLDGPFIADRPGMKNVKPRLVIPLQRDKTRSGTEAESWGVTGPNGATIIDAREVEPKR